MNLIKYKVMIVRDVYCRIAYFTWRFVVQDNILYIHNICRDMVDGCVEVLVTLCTQRESGLPASRVGMCFRNQNRSIWVEIVERLKEGHSSFWDTPMWYHQKIQFPLFFGRCLWMFPHICRCLRTWVIFSSDGWLKRPILDSKPLTLGQID